jgi:recombination protein U
MEQVKAHNGIAFIIIKFHNEGTPYLVDADLIIEYWNAQNSGGRKSIPKKIITSYGQTISIGLHPRIDFIKAVDAVYF